MAYKAPFLPDSAESKVQYYKRKCPVINKIIGAAEVNCGKSTIRHIPVKREDAKKITAYLLSIAKSRGVILDKGKLSHTRKTERYIREVCGGDKKVALRQLKNLLQIQYWCRLANYLDGNEEFYFFVEYEDLKEGMYAKVSINHEGYLVADIHPTGPQWR